MKNLLFALLFSLLFISPIYSQDYNRTLEIDSNVITKHQTTVNGVSLSYTATAGTQPVWDKDGKVIASLFTHSIRGLMLKTILKDLC